MFCGILAGGISPSRWISRRFIRGEAFKYIPLQKDDKPLENVQENPYQKEKKKCLLCRLGVELDYKNVRLLSQFLSSFTGRLYDKHITGLCEYQQRRLHEAIATARKAGLMPVFVKDARFLKDPRLFDPMKPTRPNPY
ncbi:28S ribosomal protein S18c, mitochondrial [Trichinella nativa]|uniref:28S ribosomal protein S18c, mitochondrial n=1 Tax=Trichinella nativa TaxID=6335 RepID=A0A0V1LRS7_9BILA|nr:28S ribosomal protein S18c, mitochondrial [Trichinella nativa]